MRGFNVPRLLVGGVVSGATLWLLESAASAMYLNKMQSALLQHQIELEPSLWLAVMSVTIALLTGLTMVFLYAAVRPRFGPGARTATIVAITLWLGGYVPSLISYEMIGLYPRTLLYQWGLVGLLEMIGAAIVGAWIYSDAGPAAS
jgi:hypothetical protein